MSKMGKAAYVTVNDRRRGLLRTQSLRFGSSIVLCGEVCVWIKESLGNPHPYFGLPLSFFGPPMFRAGVQLPIALQMNHLALAGGRARILVQFSYSYNHCRGSFSAKCVPSLSLSTSCITLHNLFSMPGHVALSTGLNICAPFQCQVLY